MLAQRAIKRIAGAVFIISIAMAFMADRGAAQLDDKGRPSAADTFAHLCADCHGADGRGQMLKQPDFRNADWQKSVTDDHLFKAIKWGREPMPFYYGQLTDEEIESLVKFVRSLAAQNARVDNCVACHKNDRESIVGLYEASVHSRQGISCSRCHGGVPSATGKAEAHGQRFVGKPDPNGIVGMCGSCHRPEAEMFRASRHFAEQKGIPRLDCVQCHGAHTVGSASREFSFSLFCAGCHGLEYLPPLPESFQRVLALSDDINDTLRANFNLRRHMTEAEAAERKAIQREIAEIVHPAALESGLKKIPAILKRGEELKATLKQQPR
ncbi:MAG TPA: c-type cytochrome [Blastocatellia bacterium]|nr:c-type cytochrome [Blastocatellia bacterium]